MSDPLHIGFAGTPDFAATILNALLQAGHIPKLVLTQPDRPTGRGRKILPSSVKQLALAHNIAVDTPTRLKGYPLAERRLDLLIVAAYGLILPAAILDAPRLGCLNVHASLLPRWRGAAPVERAIMAGDRQTGVCLMQMDAGLDTGPIYRCEALDIASDETGGALEARLAQAGARLLVTTLPELANLTATPQPAEGVTYAEKLGPADSIMDWHTTNDAAARRIRALADRQPVAVYAAASDQPDAAPARIRLLGASAPHPDEVTIEHAAEPGTILKIDKTGLWVACASGAICINGIQLNRGKGRPMTANAAANGYPSIIAPGRRLLSSQDACSRS